MMMISVVVAMVLVTQEYYGLYETNMATNPNYITGFSIQQQLADQNIIGNYNPNLRTQT